jgi:hypothetical protein
LTMVTIAMKNKEPREMNRDLDIFTIHNNWILDFALF